MGEDYIISIYSIIYYTVNPWRSIVRDIPPDLEIVFLKRKQVLGDL